MTSFMCRTTQNGVRKSRPDAQERGAGVRPPGPEVAGLFQQKRLNPLDSIKKLG
ncbi:MAG TPA: hypothetical protein VH186_11330 [Chloroflexia bacterium]|nr:hypothetical protein [Chloroflexia bacterium]